MAVATCAWVVGAVAGRAEGVARIALLVAGALLTAAAAGLPLWQHRRAAEVQSDAIDAATAARAQMRVTMEDSLDPIVHLLGHIGTSRGRARDQLRGEAVQLVVNTVAALTGPDRLRVCFFTIDRGPPPRLLPKAFAGRAGAPSDWLIAGTAAGDAALTAVRRGTWLLIDDIRVEEPPFVWDEDPPYRSVLMGSVHAGETPLGLLTLDALQPGEISQIDLPLLRLLAALLAIGLTS